MLELKNPIFSLNYEMHSKKRFSGLFPKFGKNTSKTFRNSKIIYFMHNKKTSKIIFFAISIFFTLFYAENIKAANNIGDYVKFNVDLKFEANEKSEISAVLVKTAPNLYFYVEKNWWDTQVLAKKNEILSNLDNLSSEFNNKIYPILTSVFGSEWKPGVDGDNRITILFHSMKEGAGGYFRSADGYIKLLVPNSNEREMLYLSILNIDSPQLKILVGHEFVHLIAFNQKDRILGVQEEVWLNEARADYASSILGYDNPYEGSNLHKRVKDFLNSPSNALTEWQETKYDYATVNVFFHYLVDHYGINILADSLKSKLIGIASINEILLKNGYKEDFAKIFSNWTIAIIVNNCSLDLKYCYLNQSLGNLRINPTLNFLPLTGNSSLSVTNITKNWTGNWQKIIGGNGDLKLEFSSLAGLNFQVPYVIYDKDNNYEIKFLKLDEKEKGEIDIKDFDKKYNSLIIIPSLQTKFSGFDGLELTYPYAFTVTITGNVPQEDQILKEKLLAQIDYLKKQIAQIQAKSKGGNFNDGTCFQLNSNLYFGLLHNSDVICLQQFLKSQGEDIYPKGLVTGNFGNLTKSAVIRFQEKHRAEILAPVGLLKGTGFAGNLTRQKINKLLNGS